MHPRAQQRLNGLLLILFLPTVCTLLAGCHRSYYRHQADMEVAEIIGERSVHPHWPLDFNIDVDPGSRMIDPHSADHPAMPQDDPVAHQYMHEADNKSGYPCWDVNGHSLMVENPEWKAFLPVDEDGVLRITAEDALALAQVHSPDYQQQWETLYLAALDVSAERFAFDTQYFFGYEPTYDAVGRLQTGSSSTSTLGLTTRTTQAQRAFTNGASLVVGLANSLIWQFSGSDSHTASTIVDFTLVQPLLQSAGRDRVMESLTLSERSLLYNVRQMERYRRGFYLDIVSGTGAQPGPVRGGFAAGGFQGGAVGRAGGFLGLLQTQQNIRNQEVNLAQLRSSFELVKLQFDAGTVDFSDREQVKQDLFNSASGLISARRAYGDTLDGFKRDLGLPPTVKMELVDDRLSQFNLIDPDLVALQNTTTDLQRDVGNVVEAFLSEKEAELDDIDNATFTWTPTIAAGLRQLREHILQLDPLLEAVLQTNIPEAREDIERLRLATPDRREAAAQISDSLESARTGTTERDLLLRNVPTELFVLDDVEQLPKTLEDALVQAEQEVTALRAEKATLIKQIDQALENNDDIAKDELSPIYRNSPQLVRRFNSNVVLEVTLRQARARAESIVLTPITIDAEVAVEVARVFRRDWMNARADLVDSWRQIEFTADDLESVLNVVFSGDIRNRGDNPLRLRDAAGRLSVGLQFDAPLTRLLERNAYRQVLIQYQQSRRSYYQVEDAIAQTMRAILRQIELDRINFELRRTALKIAVDRVSFARFQLEQQRAQLGPGSAGDVTVIQLLGALSALRRAQDDFLGGWVTYEVQRSLLDLQMGTMRLDERGRWIDPGAIGPVHGYPKREQFDDITFPCEYYPALELPAWLEQAVDSEQIPTPPGYSNEPPAQNSEVGELSLPDQLRQPETGGRGEDRQPGQQPLEQAPRTPGTQPAPNPAPLDAPRESSESSDDSNPQPATRQNELRTTQNWDLQPLRTSSGRPNAPEPTGEFTPSVQPASFDIEVKLGDKGARNSDPEQGFNSESPGPPGPRLRR